MIRIGEYQTLEIARERPQGFYLQDEEGDEVLLPRNYITDDMQIGDKIEVFAYCDSDDIYVATTEKPKLTIGEFACLKVVDVNRVGAFCDWGMLKHLFIPFSNQAVRLRKGQWAVVYMYVDQTTDRLVGTTKLRKYLKIEAGDDIKMGDEVDVLVYSETELGYGVVINQKYIGLIYENELEFPLRIGEEHEAYIKPIRPDKKIDVSLHPVGARSIEPNAQKILNVLEKNNGFLPFTDKSHPDDIRDNFGISKKLFKKAIGSLYKQKIVELKSDGIYKVAEK